MAILLQSTAYVRSFVMYLTGTKTPATGKTIAVSLSKSGAAFGAAAGAVAEIGSGWYKVSLTTADTNTVGDLAFNCTEGTCDPNAFTDQVGPVPANLKQIDELATNANLATLKLKQLSCVNSAGDAAVFSSTGGNGSGVNASGNGTGSGFYGTGGATGNGLSAIGGATSGHGIAAVATLLGTGISAIAVGSGQAGIFATGGTNGSGIQGNGTGSGSGFAGVAGLTGHGFLGQGGATSGSGMYLLSIGSGTGLTATGTSNGNGIQATGNGTGSGFAAVGGNTGAGFAALGGAASGHGFLAQAIGSGSGIDAIGVGGVSLLATQGISGPLDAAERNLIADAALKRDWTAVSGEANFSTLNALRYNRNWSISGTTLTVWADQAQTVPAFTANLTTDAAGVPVVKFAS